MINSQPLSIVIRIENVTAARLDLEAALRCEVDRYEPSGTSSYAQLDIDDVADKWSAATQLIRAISERIRKLTSEGTIGHSSMDIALAFPGASLATSASIPAGLAEAAGHAGMDIEISVYRTEETVN